MHRSVPDFSVGNAQNYPPDTFFQAVKKHEKEKPTDERHRYNSITVYIENAVRLIPHFSFQLIDTVNEISINYPRYKELAHEVLTKELQKSTAGEEVLEVIRPLLHRLKPDSPLAPSVISPRESKGTDSIKMVIYYFSRHQFDEAFLLISKAMLKKTAEQQAVLQADYWVAFETLLEAQLPRMREDLELKKKIQEHLLPIVVNLNKNPAWAYDEFERIVKKDEYKVFSLDLRRLFIVLAAELDPAAQKIILMKLNTRESKFSTSSNAKLSEIGSFASSYKRSLQTYKTSLADSLSDDDLNASESPTSTMPGPGGVCRIM